MRLYLRDNTFIVSILFGFFICSLGHAQSSRAGAQFLQLGVGARELGLGTAASAITHDVHALYWNPAGLTQISKTQLGFTHGEWLLNSRYNFMGFAKKGSLGTFGMSGTYLSHEDQVARDQNGEKIGTFSNSDWSLGLAYAQQTSPQLSFGANVKFLQSRIYNKEATGVAVDLGTLLHFVAGVPSQLAFTVRHLGPEISFGNDTDPLPLTLALGFAQEYLNLFLVSVEAQYEPYDEETRFVLGTEFNLNPTLSLRGGYALKENPFENEEFGISDMTGLVGGFGIGLNSLQLDYAFLPFNNLGETHRFSLLIKY